jgi:3-isopropylmalate dehydratase small subunit
LILTGASGRIFRSIARPRDAKIMVGARNFGCGSSREAAVYALYDYASAA